MNIVETIVAIGYVIRRIEGVVRILARESCRESCRASAPKKIVHRRGGTSKLREWKERCTNTGVAVIQAAMSDDFGLESSSDDGERNTEKASTACANMTSSASKSSTISFSRAGSGLLCD